MSDHTELKRLVDFVLKDRRFCGDENHKALAEGVLALIAENEALRKDAELNAQIQRAAGELPIGWEIRVSVEHESGYVELWDQDGCEVDFPNSCESLGLTVSDAIDAALGHGEQS